MLTVHLLTRNDGATLNACLESIKPLDPTVLVGDLGSTDDTLSICQAHKVDIVSLPWEGDYSKARNSLLGVAETDWQLWLEPWEVFDSGHEQLRWAVAQDKAAYKVYTVQGELIVKQARLWKRSCGSTFSRPVYESLDPEPTATLLNCVVRGSAPSRFEETMRILQEWKRSKPHYADVDYYLACTYVTSGRYDEFLRSAENFLFRSSEVSAAMVLTHYYYALVQLLFRNNHAECIKHVIYCLSQEPTMAEFWCLLGDAFFRMKQFHRAAAFYDNAPIFGSRRLSDDPYPVEIAKYREYPDKMLGACREIIRAMHSPAVT